MGLLPAENDTLKPSERTAEPEIEVHVEGDAVEVVDDTPPEDRNRPPLKEDPEPTDEEMEEYSEQVKRRIGKLKHGIHDERRAKEAVTRERDEAIAIAQKIFAEKQALEARSASHEEAFIAQNKEKVGMSMADAKREYKAAYEIGDADAMADAQEKMALVTLERKQAEDWSQQAAVRKQNALQTPPPVVQSPQPSQVRAPEPDRDASSWADKNKWFGQDEEMTSFAYGVHDKLVKQGVDPALDATEYYQKLNTRMREVFPSYEWEDKPKRKTTTVVAAVNRTSKTATRVTLTQSQVAVARRMGITPLQYATELAKLEK